MITKKVLVLDFTIQKGHININKAYIEALKKSFEVKLMTSNSYANKLGFKNDYVIPEELLKAKNRYYYAIHLAQAIRYVKRNVLNKHKFDAIVILGFENISFAFAWRFIRQKTFAFIHNNLTRKSLSSFCFKFISRRVSFLMLEDYLVKELKPKIKNKLLAVPHPINPKVLNLPVNNTQIVEGQIFCPSARSDINEVNRFKTKILEQNKYKLILKAEEELITEKVIQKPFFDNYFELMLESEYVLIPFEFDLRVSGVFYEAMALNKKVLTTKNSRLFMKEMQKLYPNSVWIVESIEDINRIQIDEQIKNKEHKSFIEYQSNETISECFKSIVN